MPSALEPEKKKPDAGGIAGARNEDDLTCCTLWPDGSASGSAQEAPAPSAPAEPAVQPLTFPPSDLGASERLFPYLRRIPLLRTVVSSIYGDHSLADLHPSLSLSDFWRLYEEVSQLAPPESHYLVGLGRSPFFLTALRNLVEPGSAIDVPLSYHAYHWTRCLPRGLTIGGFLGSTRNDLEPYSWGKRSEWINADSEPYAKVWRQLPQLRELLFSHLDRFFPPEAIVDGRTILLLDFADYGTSLGKFYADVRAYLETRGRAHTVECLFLEQRHHSPGSYWGDGRWIQHLFSNIQETTPKFSTVDLREHESIRTILDEESLKRFAPHPHFCLDPEHPGSSARLAISRKYRRFAAALRAEFLSWA